MCMGRLLLKRKERRKLWGKACEHQTSSGPRYVRHGLSVWSLSQQSSAPQDFSGQINHLASPSFIRWFCHLFQADAQLIYEIIGFLNVCKTASSSRCLFFNYLTFMLRTWLIWKKFSWMTLGGKSKWRWADAQNSCHCPVPMGALVVHAI